MNEERMMHGVRALLGALLLTPSALAAQESLRLTLKDAVARAQERGPLAVAARETRDAARARDRAFGASLLPQASLTGTAPSFNRSIIPVLQPDGSTLYRAQEQNESNVNVAVNQRIPILGGDLFINSALSRLDVVGNTSTRTWSATPMTVGIRQDIFRPNRQRWDNREQVLRAESAERTYREALEEIAITTANLFFDHYTARLNLANAESNATVNDTLFTLNKGRFEVGRIGENDLLQSELALLRAQASLEGARVTYDRTLASLRLALDLPLGSPLEIVVEPPPATIVADTARAVAMALRSRAQMRDLELQEVQAERRVVEAKRGTGFGGTIQASMGLNQTASQLPDAYRDPREAQRFTFGLSMPIVQWGGRSAQIAATEYDQRRVAVTTRFTREQISQEAHFAVLELGQAARQLSIAAKADTVGARRFDVAKNRYVIGRIGADNLYQAQTEKDAALLQYLQSVRAYWVAYYRLRRLTMFDFERGVEIR
jgi:outer membrane protein TolC